MKYTQYRISAQAIIDLEEIWFYTLDNWSIEQADRYYKAIISEIEYVTKHFDSGKSITKIRTGYRSSKVNLHIVFYKKANDGIVEIVRILHERMDIKHKLEE